MDYADDSCALRRTFGGEDNRVWLELRQFAPGEEFLVTVGSASFKALKQTPKSRFEPGGPLREQYLAAFGAYGEGAEGLSFPDTLRPVRLGENAASLRPWSEAERDEREKSITGLYLDHGFDRELILHTGELKKPMDAMRSCLDDLLAHWDIDPAIDRTLSARVLPRNQRRWATPIQSRFPTGLLYLGSNSRVTFRLIVNAEGKVEGCRVLRPVVDQRYEKTICDILLDRAEFEPARDADQQPVKSYYLLHVIYAVH